MDTYREDQYGNIFEWDEEQQAFVWVSNVLIEERDRQEDL